MIGRSIFVTFQRKVHELIVDAVYPWPNNEGCLYVVQPVDPKYKGTRFIHSDEEYYHSADDAARTMHPMPRKVFSVGDTLFHVNADEINIYIVKYVDKRADHTSYACVEEDGVLHMHWFQDFDDEIFASWEEAFKQKMKLQAMKDFFSSRDVSSSVDEHVPLYKVGDVFYVSDSGQVEPYKILSVTMWPRKNGCMYWCQQMVDSYPLKREFHSDDPTVFASEVEALQPREKATRQFHVDQIIMYPIGFSNRYLYNEYRILSFNERYNSRQMYCKSLTKDCTNYVFFYTDDEKICVNTAEMERYVDKDIVHCEILSQSLLCDETLSEPTTPVPNRLGEVKTAKKKRAGEASQLLETSLRTLRPRAIKK